MIICLEFACGPADATAIPKTPSSLASFKSRLVLPFWYRLTQVVRDKRPLNCGHSSSSNSLSLHTVCFSAFNTVGRKEGHWACNIASLITSIPFLTLSFKQVSLNYQTKVIVFVAVIVIVAATFLVHKILNALLRLYSVYM